MPPSDPSVPSPRKCFDVVVLTASNASQEIAFQEQLESMKDQLPSYCQYVVVADPPNAKVGNGGSTMHVIHRLDEMFGEKMADYRVLLIHAGGFSQRLPHVSVLGKAFGLVPIGNRVMTCMEFCMESFSPFAERMIPGIFLCCADVLLTFECSGHWAFDKPGFTALAHPSSTKIGTTHGVFCLSHPKEAIEAYDSKEVDVRMESCRRFLHKPSVDIMKKECPVVEGSDTVFTDSTFFFDYKTAMRLRDFHLDHLPLLDEIDAYGDFLQALGPEASEDYCANTANVSFVTKSLVETRRGLYRHLSGTDLHTLLMYKSSFSHIGTTKEYIHHYTNDLTLRRDLKLRNVVEVATIAAVGEESNEPKRAPVTQDFEGRCLMACLFEDIKSSTVGPNVVLEYCRFAKHCCVEGNSILSRTQCPEALIVPQNSFLHTVDVSVDGQHGYVTIALNINDNMKAKVAADKPGELVYNSVKLCDAAKYIDRADDSPESFFEPGERCLTLWTCRLFPAFTDAEKSVGWGVEMLKATSGAYPVKLCDSYKESLLKKESGDAAYFGMADILKHKDTKSMLQWRKDLRKQIAEAERVDSSTDL